MMQRLNPERRAREMRCLNDTQARALDQLTQIPLIEEDHVARDVITAPIPCRKPACVQTACIRRLDDDMPARAEGSPEHREHSLWVRRMLDDLVQHEHVDVSRSGVGLDGSGNHPEPVGGEALEMRTGVVPSNEFELMPLDRANEAQECPAATSDVHDDTALRRVARDEFDLAPLDEVAAGFDDSRESIEAI